MSNGVRNLCVSLLLLPVLALGSIPQNFTGQVTGNDVRLTWDPLSPTDDVEGRQEPLHHLNIYHRKPDGSFSSFRNLSPSLLEYTFNNLANGDHRFQLRAIYAEDPDEDATPRDSQEITVTVNDISHLPPTFTFPSSTGYYSRAVTEGGSVAFTVEKSHVTNSSYSVNYATAHDTTDNNDFQSASGTLTFAPTELSKQIVILTTQDQVSENTERFSVSLNSPTGGATVDLGIGYGLIITDDPPLPPAATEFTRIPATSGNGQYVIEVKWDQDDVDDFDRPTSVEMLRRHNGGSWVPITGGTFITELRFEYSESVSLGGTYRYRVRGCNINGCGGWLESTDVLVTIENPQFSINNAAVTEGGNLTFTVTKSGSASASYGIDYQTVSGSASSADFLAKSGRLTFAASETSKTVIVSTIDDAFAESSETFDVVLSGAVSPVTIVDGQGTGTINDDDQNAQNALPFTGVDPTNEPVTASEYRGQLRGVHTVGRDGSFNYRIPVEVPPGINGAQPALALSYNSNRRNEVAGWGWSVEGISSIHRCPADLMRDGYVSGIGNGEAYKFCLDGERLVEIVAGEYRTEDERFSRIRRFGGSERVPEYWQVERKDGKLLTFGGAAVHNAEREDGAGATVFWSISSVKALPDNLVQYSYEKNATTGVHRIQSIDYTLNPSTGTDLNHSVSFVYESAVRPDPIRKFVAGRLLNNDRRLQSIVVYAAGARVRSYDLSYQQQGQSYAGAVLDDPAQTSRLAEVRLCYASALSCASPLTFDWTSAASNDFIADGTTASDLIEDDVNYAQWVDPANLNGGAYWIQGTPEPGYRITHSGAISGGTASGDFDGDGLKELAWWECNESTNQCQHYVKMDAFASPIFVGQSINRVGLGSPPVYDAAHGGVMDFNNDGLDDYYISSTYRSEGIRAYLSNGNALQLSSGYSIAIEEIAPPITITVNGQTWNNENFPFHVELRDMTGDGLVDVFLATPVSDDPTVASLQDSGETGIYVAVNTGSGFGPYERWGTATDYQTHRKVNYADFGGRKLYASQRLADVNADGLPDIVGFLPEWPVEVGINTGSGFLPPVSWTSTSIPRVINHSQPYYSYECPPSAAGMQSMIDKISRLGDFNGDGATDIAYLLEDGLYVALSNGTGFEPAFRWSDAINLEKALCGSAYYPPAVGDPGTFFGRYLWSTADLNFDGRSDIKIEIERTQGPQEEDIHGVLYSRSKPDTAGQGFSSLRIMYREPFDYSTERELTKLSDSFVTEQDEVIFVDGHSRTEGSHGERFLRAWESFKVGARRARMVGVHEGAARSVSLDYAPVNRNTELYTQNAGAGTTITAAARNERVSYRGFEGDRFQAAADQTQPTARSAPHTVTDLTVTEHGTPRHTTAYRYTNHRVHSRAYGSLGFEKVEETRRFPTEPLGLRTITEYVQAATPAYKVSGKVARQLTCAVDSNDEACGNQAVILSDERNRWRVRVYSDDIDSGANSPHFFPYIFESSMEKWDLNATYVGSTRFRAYATGSLTCNQIPIGLTKIVADVNWRGYGGDAVDNYDADGVLPYSSSLNCASSPVDDQSVVHEEKRLLNVGSVKTGTRWLLGLVGREEVTASTGTSAYTLDAGQTRTVAYTYYGSGLHQGRLLAKTVEPDIPSLRLSTSYEYNQYGSVSREIESWNNLTNDGLDFVSRDTRAAETFLAGGDRRVVTTNALGHVTTALFNAEFGLAQSFVDANGLTTLYAYDSLGREVSVTHPNNTQTLTDYAVCTACLTFESATAWFQQTKVPGESAQRIYFDGLDRDVGTQNVGLNGEYIYTHKTYDARGNLASVSEPFTGGVSQFVTSHQYDVLDRITITGFPDGSLERHDYHGLEQITTNRLNQVNRRVLNGVGWVMRSVDNAGTHVESTYTGFGDLLTTLVDNRADTLTQVGRDVLGRKTSLVDPNTGLRTYEHNPLGLVAREIDAEGQVTQNAYDKLGRLLTRIDDAAAAGSAQRTHSWTYDNKANGIGLVGRVSGFNSDGSTYVEESEYDSLSRLVETETAIGGQSFTLEYFFDDLDRQIGTAYPSGYLMARLHNSYGHLSKITEAATGELIWEANTADARMNITEFALGNGATTLRDYDPATGRVERISTYRSGVTIQDHEYTFDFLGNLRQRVDYVAGLTQDFCYDNLNRLVAARFNGCSSSSQDFTYDVLGNILTKAGVSGSYQYGANGAGPNAVTQADGLSYEYDANGNMIAARNSGNSVVKTVDYGAFNKPTYFSNGGKWSQIAYGPHRSRVTREDDTGRNTVYVGGVFEYVDDNGVQEQVHYLGDFGMYVSRGGLAGETYKLYTHRDHIDSVVARSKDTGSAEKLGYGPWGLRLEANWGGVAKGPSFAPEASSRGFTDHEHLDGVGLIHMNGRVYSPTLGRFLSPDPHIQAPLNTQSYNRYSYVWNNPLSYTDPTGEILWVPVIWGAVKVAGWALTAHGVYETAQTAIEIHDEIQSGEKTAAEVLDERKVEIAVEAGMTMAGPVVKAAERLVPESVQDRITGKISEVAGSGSGRNAGGADNADALSVPSTPGQRLADRAQSSRSETGVNTVAVIKHQDGTVTVGRNSGGVNNADVQESVSRAPQSCFGAQCAEINAISRAKNKGRDTEGATIETRYVRGNNPDGRHGELRDPCETCEYVIEDMGLEEYKPTD
ncbi:MAG: Calx-beta domain-containing protein [Pseudomonadota bacterium]